MSAKAEFDPEKLAIIEFKIIKAQVDTPEDFLVENIVDHQVKNDFRLAFNLEKKLIKADLDVYIKTRSGSGNISGEATGNFHLVFIFHIDNLEKLANLNENNIVIYDQTLGLNVALITYSTSRGILLTRLQGTALQGFILPVLDPNKLIYK
jgi:hypothetical protein